MGTKKRLMIITHDLAIGGLQQVIVNICNTIDRSKFNVSVLCLRDLGDFAHDIEEMGISVEVIQQRQEKTDYLSFLKVAEILRREKTDIIHTHNTQPFIDGTIAALMTGVKTIVHTDHARSFPDKKRYMFAEWLMSHFAYKIVGVSDHTSQNLIMYEKISPKKVVTIPNGIDGSRFQIIIDKEKKRKELGILKNGPIMGLGVRLTEQKGITYLLQAMPEIIKEIPNVTLVIAGEGPLDDSLKKECISLGLEENVLFVGRRLDIPELIKLFDLYVLPSLWEGLPMVLLEAMAAGCPIVATDVGGNSTLIEDGFNGSLVKSGDFSALSKEVIKLLIDRDICNKYSANSKKRFDDKFSANYMTKQYERLYLRANT
jgi:glycosyltransferase involved in cell wall biosynthesis